MSKDILYAIAEEYENQTEESSYEADEWIRSWDDMDDMDSFLSIFGN